MPLALPSCPKCNYSKIEIGEGLTSLALSHHPACGTVSGGSCGRCLQVALTEEEKQPLLGKETIGQRHSHRPGIGLRLRPFAGYRDAAGTLSTNSQ